MPYSIKTAKWIGDCFIYTTASNKLSYFVGNESYTISPLDTYDFSHFLSDLPFGADSTLAGRCSSWVISPHTTACIWLTRT